MNNFEILARALIIKDDRVLLVKRTGADYYFIPGGHVEFGEKAEQALMRELKEEIGILAKSLYQIGINENIYEADGKKHHEYNLVFKVELPNYEVKSRESHLTFFWLPIDNLDRTKILPLKLKKSLTKWLSDQKPF